MAKKRPNRKHRLGREAIEALKTAYRDGAEFADVYAVRAFVIGELGVKPAFVPVDAARNWDRTARLENADADYATTSPSRKNGFKRTPNADGDERSDSHLPALKGLRTRGNNELRIAKANAAQPDAMRVEIQRAARLEIVVPMLELLIELDS